MPCHIKQLAGCNTTCQKLVNQKSFKPNQEQDDVKKLTVRRN